MLILYKYTIPCLQIQELQMPALTALQYNSIFVTCNFIRQVVYIKPHRGYSRQLSFVVVISWKYITDKLIFLIYYFLFFYRKFLASGITFSCATSLTCDLLLTPGGTDFSSAKASVSTGTFSSSAGVSLRRSFEKL